MPASHDSPLISIVLPVHNGADALPATIRSVLGQTLADWELLAVDDGSTDGTREMLRTWAPEDPRIRPIKLEERTGTAAARNAGLRHASGRLIAYLDPGDTFYPDHLENVARYADRGDVLVFAYDVPDGDGAVRTWEPAALRENLFAVDLAAPLGVAHRRHWSEKLGGFNELLWCDEAWDLWKRLARAGAEFVFLPLRSGRLATRPAGPHRGSRPTAAQRAVFEANWRAGRPIYDTGPPVGDHRKVRKIAFVSPYCLIDHASGATVATVSGLRLLGRLGFEPVAFCGSLADLPQGPPWGDIESKQHGAHSPAGTICVRHETIETTIFRTADPRGRWSGDAEVTAFYQACGAFLDAQRPDVVLTFGGDPTAQTLVSLAKNRDIPVVFYLCNFAYPETAAFRTVDYVLVLSEYARQRYWNDIGLASHHLSPIVDPNRVMVTDRRPRFLTMVNPQPVKGIFVLAGIAEMLARRRPDIRLLVVEGRTRSAPLRQVGIDLAGMKNVEVMAATADPRRFYAQSRILLMPSLWDESFGLCAAEAMLNGIPVVASSRGALPETLGGAGFLVDVPERYTPQTAEVPSEAELEPWVEIILRLWDDADAYRQASNAAARHAQQWCPEQLAPTYEAFFANLSHQPGPPYVPKDGD